MLNEIFEDDKSKTIAIFILGSFLIILAIVFKIVENTAIRQYYRGYNNLFASSELNIDNKQSFITVNDIESFNYCKSSNTCYYTIYSDLYSFVALLNTNDADILKNTNLDNNNIRIIGTTKKINNVLKNTLITEYNKGYEDLYESQINTETFDEIFGKNYLDTTSNKKNTIVDNNKLTKTPRILFIIFLILGFSCYICSLVISKKNNN